MGGSLAFADPAGELPALALALDGRLLVQNVQSARCVAAEEFFIGAFTTALAADELLVGLRLPALPDGCAVGFAEVGRRQNHRALAGAVAVMTLHMGHVVGCRLALFGLGARSMLCPGAADVLRGEVPGSECLDAAAAAVDGVIDPASDVHASAGYRRHLARVVARRALASAAERAASRH